MHFHEFADKLTQLEKRLQQDIYSLTKDMCDTPEGSTFECTKQAKERELLRKMQLLTQIRIFLGLSTALSSKL